MEQRLQVESEALCASVLDRYEALDFAGALGETWSWVGQLNQRIVAVSPWELAKDPARQEELHAFLYRLLESIRLVAGLVSPVVPEAAGRIAAMLGAAPETSLGWGKLEPGASLGEIQPLFPRLEDEARKADQRSSRDKKAKKEEVAVADATPPAEEPASPDGDRLDIDEFARIDLRVAEVKAAEKVKGSKKLLRLQVDLGTEQRQVVAGIAQWYEPEQLVGRKVALVANLKPAKLMGVESNGMVLAASPEGKAVLLTFDADVAPGTRIR